jgi:hypothetical protein
LWPICCFLLWCGCDWFHTRELSWLYLVALVLIAQYYNIEIYSHVCHVWWFDKSVCLYF